MKLENFDELSGATLTGKESFWAAKLDKKIRHKSSIDRPEYSYRSIR